jgi:hypothetical protein
LIPERASDQNELAELCQQMLAFENQFCAEIGFSEIKLTT